MISLFAHIYSGAWIGSIGLPVLIPVWIVLSVIVGVGVAGAIARRDTQVPPEPPLRAVAECPTDPCPGIHTHSLEEL